jgi:hypothetical protein
VPNLNIVYEQKYVPNTKTKLHLPAGLIRIRIQIGIDNFKKAITLHIRNDLQLVSKKSGNENFPNVNLVQLDN